MLFNREGSAQGRRQNALLAMLLAGVAGTVNAIGFYLLGTHTSHMSGKVSELGEALASGSGLDARAAARLLLAFFCGAVSSSILMDAARHRSRGRHSLVLLLELVMLGGVGYLCWRHPGVREPTLGWGLSFAMGLQNALVTRVSGAVVRTSHVTGMVTDLGIELVRMGTWVRDHARGRGVLGMLRALRALVQAVEFERAWLHVFLLASFLGGCVAGTLLHVRYGALALGAPCCLLVALVGLDWRPRRGTPATVSALPGAQAQESGPAPFIAQR